MELVLYIILRGFAIGVLVSAPMGPIGVLCIQRTMNKGRWAGFYTGLGAAISDLMYSLLAGLGLSIVIDFIEANQNPLQISGKDAPQVEGQEEELYAGFGDWFFVHGFQSIDIVFNHRLICEI